MSGESRLVFKGENGTYEVIGPLAYWGKVGCVNVTCTHMVTPEGIDFTQACMGWHCSYCDAPCSSQGHRCDASEAILGEARRIAAPSPGSDPEGTDG